MKKMLILLLMMMGPMDVSARTLSNAELFKRCYAQLTGRRPSASILSAGQANPLANCLALLQKAKIDAGGSIAADSEAKNVLKQMNHLHESWFMYRDFGQIERFRTGTKDLWDPGTPALYYTKALLGDRSQAASTYAYSSVITGSSLLLAKRTSQDPPKGAYSGVEKSKMFIPVDSFQFAPQGELIGILTVPPKSVSFTCNDPFQTGENLGSTQLELQKNLGGGYIGNYIYIINNVRSFVPGDTNGAVRMPRRWGRSVYHDVLCRDLPVVRNTDGDPFVVPTSSTPFRQSNTCVHCHSSMDRASFVLRGISTTRTLCSNGEVPDMIFFRQITQPAATGSAAWPSNGDDRFSERPTDGNLYFRNYKGDLIDVPVSGVGDLGTKLAQQDDFYICAAKRYYKYFLGVDANISDPGAPGAPTLSAKDAAVRQKVIDLGLELKRTNDLQKLISDILNLPAYKLSNFGE